MVHTIEIMAWHSAFRVGAFLIVTAFRVTIQVLVESNDHLTVKNLTAKQISIDLCFCGGRNKDKAETPT